MYASIIELHLFREFHYRNRHPIYKYTNTTPGIIHAAGASFRHPQWPLPINILPSRILQRLAPIINISPFSLRKPRPLLLPIRQFIPLLPTQWKLFLAVLPLPLPCPSPCLLFLPHFILLVLLRALFFLLPKVRHRHLFPHTDDVASTALLTALMCAYCLIVLAIFVGGLIKPTASTAFPAHFVDAWKEFHCVVPLGSWSRYDAGLGGHTVRRNGRKEV
ncbi:hypothetical protein EJ04DRAFT_356935 [Polyplosphaeria fusca]|uniref:Uncharacterized protein n=1 Tax=Polyplosphaeria fusca TaxID=682080 RepID=A0A9P4R555_9PLEO|nr:hypothetical protein EJ04DRAFT_356935 [Polyplosphaeria fusca]